MTRTLTDIHVLTDAELRKAIAEAQGFVVKHGYMDKAGINPKDYWVTPEGRLTSVLPNYPACIEDAYALEESVPESERPTFISFLVDIVAPDTRSIGWSILYALAHATARQRSEAWLAWKEQQHA